MDEPGSPINVEEIINYIRMLLDNGMDLDELSSSEKQFMTMWCGEEWYKEWTDPPN